MIIKKCENSNLKFDYFTEGSQKVGKLYWHKENPEVIEVILYAYSDSDIISISTKLAQMFWTSLPVNKKIKEKLISSVENIITNLDWSKDSKIDKILKCDYELDTGDLSYHEISIIKTLQNSYSGYFVQYCSLRYIGEVLTSNFSHMPNNLPTFASSIE